METIAKQKAIKIYTENLEWIGATFYKDGFYTMSEHEKAKGCSLAAVNEILSWNKTLFWENVKEEINKL